MTDNSDSLIKKAESFIPIINIIYKSSENFQKIFCQNISEINQILSSIENNLQSITLNKISNIKSLIASNQKKFLAYINDSKISLNNFKIAFNTLQMS